jgi:nicotinic acid mononucleotide adenylyltransferase
MLVDSLRLHRLKDLNIKLYVTATGAGAGIQERIWNVPGCSSFFAGASFPYAKDKVIQFLGYEPKQFTSKDTAIDLAVASYKRALTSIDAPGQKAVGVGVCASVSSVQDHRGDHRFHVCVITPDLIKGHTSTLIKYGKTEHPEIPREGDGREVDLISLITLLAALNLTPDGGSEWLYTPEDWSDRARELFFEHPLWLPDGRRKVNMAGASDHNSHMFLPGSFDPPHYGHHGMAKAVEGWHRKRPTFMIDATPPHKEHLSVQEMIRRRVLLKNDDVLFTQNAPLFLDKAKLYPNSEFVIGADTYNRMIDPKWGIEPSVLINQFKELGVRFHVFRREGAEISSLHGHPNQSAVFVHHPGDWNVSSTELRKVQSGQTVVGRMVGSERNAQELPREAVEAVCAHENCKRLFTEHRAPFLNCPMTPGESVERWSNQTFKRS